jgi:hypothetical protein
VLDQLELLLGSVRMTYPASLDFYTRV